MTYPANDSSRPGQDAMAPGIDDDPSDVAAVSASVPEHPVLDHFTLRTHDLEGTRAFFEAVLGLEPGYRPAFSFPGYWLYADGEPIVHLIPGHGGRVDRAGETIDHVAFRLPDHARMKRRLDDLSIPYSAMELPQLGERRLFIQTPTGILIELVFREPRADRHPSGPAG